MFESVAPETFQARSRRLFYETLPVSIALHLIVIAAVVAATLWTVVFPEQSPRAVRSYILTSDPPPPPPPPPPAARAPQPAVAPPPPALVVLAPTKIPDLIPTVVDSPPPIEPPPVAAAPQVPAPQPDEIGGKLGGRGGGVAFPDDGRVHIERNQQLPLQVVSQDYPRYPDSEKKAQREDQVIVRYIIGKDGRVNDVQILSHANYPAFDDAVLDALRQWRFRPMIKDGKPVEVVHELAINFELIRH